MSAHAIPDASRGVDPREIVSRIRSVLPAAETRAALHEPRFLGNERAYVNDCIDSGWVSYAGAYVERFEAALADACGVERAVAVTSGTVALQVGLTTSGVGPGDEVLVPALTFVASANAIVHAGAVPHFVDADAATLGVSPSALEEHLREIGERRGPVLVNKHTGRRLAAVMPVHIFGHPVDMDGVNDVARRHRIAVIEDATEALGSFYKSRPCGSLADFAVLSFNGNKIATSGGGGAILTNDAQFADRVRHITTTAKTSHRWAFWHDEVAWNFRLPNINAAIGLAQLEQLDNFLAAKRKLHQRYADAFEDMPGLRVFVEAPDARSNYWLVSLILDGANGDLLELILLATNDAGLMTRPIWTPMHLLPMYSGNPRAPLPVTLDLAKRVFNVPSSTFLATL